MCARLQCNHPFCENSEWSKWEIDMVPTHNEENESPKTGHQVCSGFAWAMIGCSQAATWEPMVESFVDGVMVLLAWFIDLNRAAPLISLASGSICILLAVLLGAFRQLCSYMLSRAAPIQTSDIHGKESTLYLGTYFPGWLSLRYRLWTWLVVALSSLWAAPHPHPETKNPKNLNFLTPNVCFLILPRCLLFRIAALLSAL